MTTKVNKTVNENVNEVMDARIVKLNEFKSVKMAAISKGKRPAAKEAKGLALFVLENWDNVQQLENLLENALEDTKTELGKEVLDIAQDRRNQLSAPVIFKDVHGKEIKAGNLIKDLSEGFEGETNEVFEDEGKLAINQDGTTIYLEEIDTEKTCAIVSVVKATEFKLTKKEQVALEFFVKADDGEGFFMERVMEMAEDIISRMKMTEKSVKGLLSSLQKKGLISMNNGDSYFDGKVTDLGKMMYSILAKEETPKNSLGNNKTARQRANAQKKATDKEIAEVKKGEPKKAEPKKEDNKQASSTKKVGDIHKNGKWVWTEYKAGKFDWRTIPTMKQKTGAKPKEEGEKKAESKPTAKKANEAKKSNAKQTKKGETKKNSPEAPKLLTIEDFKAMPKAARGNAKPSKAQQEALKLIQKGYWIWNNGGSYFFKNETGDSKSCNMESVKAMFKRYGIDYIPEGLVK